MNSSLDEEKKEGGPEVARSNDTPQEQEEQIGYEIGDTVQIVGGPLNESHGILYYIDDELIKILPDGITNKVLTIPIADIEELGIENIIRIEKAVQSGFVNLIGFEVDGYVETFDKEGAAGPIFQVLRVDPTHDTVVVKTELGDELAPIEFSTDTYQGIPRDLPFEVIRTREPPATEEKEKKEGDDVVAALAQLEGEEGDENRTAIQQEEQGVPVLEVLEEIDEVVEGGIEEIPSAERIYPDSIQLTELLTGFMRRLTAAQQKNPERIRELARKVEVFLSLRNEVIKYGVAGEPRGIQETSLSTLAQLLQQPDVPLSRKVVKMIKTLYLDHTTEHLLAKAEGRGDIDPVGQIEDNVEIQYLEDVLKKAISMDEHMRAGGAGGADGPALGLPRFFLEMENVRQQIYSPYTPIVSELEGGKQVSKDEEVFREEEPTKDDPSVHALATNSFSPPPAIQLIDHSIVRFLKSKQGRFLSKEGDPIRTVEGGEVVSATKAILFPRSAIRGLGPIRSGKLIQDMSLSQSPPILLQDYLAAIGESTDFPTADGLLSIGLEGGILGNVSIKDWLESQKLPITGYGDALHLLRPYGLHRFEFSMEQVAVLNQKILETLAALRKYLSEKRQEAKQFLETLRFSPAGLLEPSEAQRLLERAQSEPILREHLDRATEEYGELASIDMYWLPYLYMKSPDLLIGVLGQQPRIIAKERLSAVRDQFIHALQVAHLLRAKIASEGEMPTINKCPHVEDLEKVRKVKGDDATRMKLLIQVVSDYRGPRKDNWIWCNACEKHLICAHELYMIQEFLQPRDQEALQKEMYLTFSGGVFHGKYICKNCGQPMRDLDFSQSLEYNDEGVPMVGRSVMEEDDQARAEQLEDLFTAPGAAAELESSRINWGSEDANLMYQLLVQITDRMGISPEEKDYEKIIVATTGYMGTLLSRSQYAALVKQQAARGATIVDYDIFRMRFLISVVASYLLINIQTRKPDYIVRHVSEVCAGGFFGYPLESETNKTGIECLAGVLATFMRDEAPWNQTGFQKEANYQKRKALWMKQIETRISEFVKDALVQSAIKEKRKYLEELYGSAGGDRADQIPKTFRPVPLLLTVEEAAAAPIDAAVATKEDSIGTAWIREGHKIAKQSAILQADNPYSETTCCFHEIQNPSGFWTEHSPFALPDKHVRIESKRSAFRMPLAINKHTELKGEISESSLYRLFTNVCYEGPRKGLPHELGLTLRCRWCALQFPEHPSNTTSFAPYSSDKEAQKRLMAEYVEEQSTRLETLRTSLVSQGATINQQTFQDVLDESHRKFQVPAPETPLLPRVENTLSRVANITVEPLEGWGTLVEGAFKSIQEVGGSPTELQIAKACEPLVAKITECEQGIRTRIGGELFKVLTGVPRLSPREMVEVLNTQFIVPLSRWLTGLRASNPIILKTYELADKTIEDIHKGLEPHTRALAGGVELFGLSRAKVEKAVRQWSTARKEIFPILRTILTPGGQLMITYIHRALLMGPLYSLLDPQDVPEDADSVLEGGTPIKEIYKAVAQIVDRIKEEALNYTDEQIKTFLEARREKEKQLFIRRLDRLSKEQQQIEKLNKRMGLGQWAVTAKEIRFYDEERYEKDRAERALAGIVDYQDPYEGRQYDMMGFNYGAEYERDGGYNHKQMNEEDA